MDASALLREQLERAAAEIDRRRALAAAATDHGDWASDARRLVTTQDDVLGELRDPRNTAHAGANGPRHVLRSLDAATRTFARHSGDTGPGSEHECRDEDGQPVTFGVYPHGLACPDLESLLDTYAPTGPRVSR